jgi:hypothetical protein
MEMGLESLSWRRRRRSTMRTAQVVRLNFSKKPTLVFLINICSMSGLLFFVQVHWKFQRIICFFWEIGISLWRLCFVVLTFAALPISSLFPFLYFMVSMLFWKVLFILLLEMKVGLLELRLLVHIPIACGIFSNV